MRLKYRMVVALLALATAQQAAAADKPGLPDFIACDDQGYPERDDGFGDYVFQPGVGAGERFMGSRSELLAVRRLIKLGSPGVAACDRALQNPGLLPQQFPRRAQLLRSRAFHQTKIGDFDAALASLDRADAEIAKTPVWIDQDSFRTGTDMLRAHVLIERDRKADAAAVVDRIAARWPHSDMIQVAVQAYRMRLDSSRENELKLLAQRNIASPMFLRRQVVSAAIFGDFATVDRLGGLVQMKPPAPLPGWNPTARLSAQQPLVLDAQAAGLWAYAAAVQGRPDDAVARLAAMRATIDATMLPPPPPPEGKKQRKSLIDDYMFRRGVGQHALAAIDQWQAAVTLRRDIQTLGSEAAMAKAEKASIPPPALFDIVRVLATLKDGEKRDAVTARDTIEKMIDEEAQKSRAIALEEVYRGMPDMMSKAELPGFKRSDGVWIGNENGYSVKHEDGDPANIFTVRFTHLWAPAHVVDELLEMACAKYARDKGYDGFILLNRQLVSRSYVGYAAGAAGYEAGARLIFVNANALPPELEAQRWRIVDAGSTFDAIYAKHFAQQATIKAETGYKTR